MQYRVGLEEHPFVDAVLLPQSLTASSAVAMCQAPQLCVVWCATGPGGSTTALLYPVLGIRSGVS